MLLNFVTELLESSKFQTQCTNEVNGFNRKKFKKYGEPSEYCEIVVELGKENARKGGVKIYVRLTQ